MTTEAYQLSSNPRTLCKHFSIKYSGKVFPLSCFHYKNFKDYCLGFDVSNSINFSKDTFPLWKIWSQDFLGFFASSEALVCGWSKWGEENVGFGLPRTSHREHLFPGACE